ncbi:TIGR03936 family radical SAM-associated protein [Granulicoccus sp. GXG6511]|uniref:TIGR03936 family radical SAM-associated protein n=1 Tax=Granulicoccus sp. GXG6511 TaxID=3381351 RepID=UPI003D7C7798
MSKRRQPEQQAPPVQRLRIRYAKRGRARFTSHRDFARAFERALRRADIPMAYSSGFNPHPRISFANAAPTGAATESEYLEIGLAAICDPAKVLKALDAALPPGIDVLTVVQGGGGFSDRLTGSRWRIQWQDFDADVAERAVAALMAVDEVLVERLTKHGVRQFNARAAVVHLTALPDCLELVSRHLTPLVRPDDVLRALTIVHPELGAPTGVLLTRLEQGELSGTAIGDPLAD